MCAKRTTRMLIECPELIASVRVGVLEPLKPLVNQNEIELKFKRTIEIERQDIAWCDILICVRGCELITRKIVESAKKAGRLVVYFLDDDLLNVPSNLSCTNYFNDPYLKENMIAILKASDILWTVNSLIQEKYHTYCNKSVLSKVPADFIHYSSPKDNSKVKIIYGGSESHSHLVQKYLAPVVLKICNDFAGKVDITFIGANPKIQGIGNIHHYNYFEDYDKYKTFVHNGNFDIGLAVIETDEFYQCKYYNKFIEYTSIGCVGIYTNTKPYTDVIVHQENGLLCNNSFNEWYECLKLLIENEQIRHQCLENAINKINRDFSYADVANKLIKDMPQLIMYQAPTVNYKSIKLYSVKVLFMRERIGFLWRTYKLLSIPMIFYKGIKKILKRILKLIKVKE